MNTREMRNSSQERLREQQRNVYYLASLLRCRAR